ncbi:LytTR family DNA-binding domain-containing protein [uncultured Draconibacterium sp.]|uniref:LytR/AlgR family response regulator transcription factor n=1 Tax=uncultured Draconibacterium sp. TaxID=1573823 RepID=UPI0029C83B2E|nr:LytTR family DNA-binding domain-containing protein [uncultured Draconibacterium sp.]
MDNSVIRTVIIDDEPRARETLNKMLRTYCKDVEIVGEGNNVKSGIEQIENLHPDVVFLDIRMPDGTGFDLLEQLNYLDFALVILTAYDEYALKAFKFSAIDYMLKPLDPEELINSVKKIKSSLNVENNQLKTLLENINNSFKPFQKLVLKTAESIYIVKTDDIIRIEAESNYCRFYIHNSPAIFISKTLKEYNKILQQSNFFRPHQSHLVNLNRIVRIDKQDGITIHMDDGSQVPVSFRKKDLLHAALSQLE